MNSINSIPAAAIIVGSSSSATGAQCLALLDGSIVTGHVRNVKNKRVKRVVYLLRVHAGGNRGVNIPPPI